MRQKGKKSQSLLGPEKRRPVEKRQEGKQEQITKKGGDFAGMGKKKRE